MNKHLVVLGVLLVGLAAHYFSRRNKRAGDVLSLTSQDFELNLSKYRTILVYFYLPACPHCELFSLEYEKAAKTLKSLRSSVLLAQVDCGKERKEAYAWNVKSFPTVLLFYDEEKIETYAGERAGDSLVNYALSKEQEFN